VDRIARALNEAEKAVKGSRVLLLGVSYKAGVGDIRESPSLEIVSMLRELGADLSYHDPFVPELREFDLASVDLEEALRSADVAAIVTAHPDIDYEAVVAAVPLVVDFRGVTREIDAANLIRL
jgi:UDP-N-acetyl-D-glucosamine dehydrogenase